MRAVRLTPAARRDLDGIWDYTTRNWNSEQAETYTRGLWQLMRMLSLNPKLGRNIDDIRRGYFKFPVASHVLFYQPATDGIEIIRILHKSMDVERNL